MNIFQKYTCRNLRKNKVRTIVTIIGIVLSVSMITAVTSSISSMQQFLLNVVIETSGVWHGNMKDIPQETLDKVEKDEEVERIEKLSYGGYAKLEDCKNEYMQYLYVGGMSKGFSELRSIHIKEGRMPETANEILLPEQLSSNGGIDYKIGSKVTLQLGDRLSKEGEKLYQSDDYEAETANETFAKREKRTYQVVGVYEGDLSNYSAAPSYTALTAADFKDVPSEIYFTLKKPSESQDFIKKFDLPEEKREINSAYLNYSGQSTNDTFNKVLYSLGAILIGIIMFGSISLIYNSFSISVNERTKQFGLLSSLGATKRQMMRSILFESTVLSLVGIPLGVLAGLGGIAVTFKATQDLFASFLNGTESGVSLHLSASIASILVAAVVGFVTVLISAYIPARRAMKISAIEAIRQSGDIKIKAKKVKTSWLTRKLFGLEGTLATKNFKRNKRKYRATVISLFISIVLFISASSFCDYLNKGLQDVYSEYTCDIIYNAYELDKDEAKELYEKLSGIKDVTEHVRMRELHTLTLDMEKTAWSETYYGKLSVGIQPVSGELYFMEDTEYEKWLEDLGYDKNEYMNSEHPKAIAIDFIRTNEEGKYTSFHALKEGGFKTELSFMQGEDDKESKEIKIPVEVGEITDHRPLGLDFYYGASVLLVYPESFCQTVIPKDKKTEDLISDSMYFSSSNPAATYDEMEKMIQENKYQASLLNLWEMVQANQALLLIVNVFSYGFIILISLIAGANVFNTISTNIGLRRREFAMLRSVGMTQKSFYRMMNYECLLYGLKGLLYGIPVAVGITYLIFTAVSEGVKMGFYVPWYSLLISVISVFLVVFSTMFYSMRKLKKENTIDALKNENL